MHILEQCVQTKICVVYVYSGTVCPNKDMLVFILEQCVLAKYVYVY